jgi:hypothetical protein
VPTAADGPRQEVMSRASRAGRSASATTQQTVARTENISRITSATPAGPAASSRRSPRIRVLRRIVGQEGFAGGLDTDGGSADHEGDTASGDGEDGTDRDGRHDGVEGDRRRGEDDGRCDEDDGRCDDEDDTVASPGQHGKPPTRRPGTTLRMQPARRGGAGGVYGFRQGELRGLRASWGEPVSPPPGPTLILVRLERLPMALHPAGLFESGQDRMEDARLRERST